MVVSSLLFSCSVSRWLSSVLSTSGLSNTGQKGIVVVGDRLHAWLEERRCK